MAKKQYKIEVVATTENIAALKAANLSESKFIDKYLL